MVRKSALFVALLSLAATSTFGAAIEYRWFDTTGGDLVDNNDSAIAAGNATILTYVSEDSAIDFDSGLPLSSSYGNDVFHSSMGNLLIDGKYLTSFAYEPGTSHVGSYVYAVILDLPYDSFVDIASVPAGTYYGLTSLGDDPALGGSPNQLMDTDGTNPAQSFMGGDVKTSSQVIPEPGQLILLLASAVFYGLFYGRRHRTG